MKNNIRNFEITKYALHTYTNNLLPNHNSITESILANEIQIYFYSLYLKIYDLTLY